MTRRQFGFLFWLGGALEWIGIVGLLWRWRKGPA